MSRAAWKRIRPLASGLCGEGSEIDGKHRKARVAHEPWAAVSTLRMGTFLPRLCENRTRKRLQRNGSRMEA